MQPLSIRGLTLLSRTSAPWCWNIAAYHDPRSMTWSWVLSFSRLRPGEHRFWPVFWTWHRKWSLRVPFVGVLNWQTQEKVPFKPWHASYYRDLESKFGDGSTLQSRDTDHA